MTEPVSNEAEQVSNEEAHVELITKEPIASKPVVAKKKDPRKIEAGKKLAAYNKKAKSSKAELAAHSAASSVDSESNQGGSGFNITLTTVVAIIGLGLTASDLYLRHKKMSGSGVSDLEEKKKLVAKYEKPVDHTVKLENEKSSKQGGSKVRFSQGME